MDDAVHTSEDLTKQVALPLLGIIPELPKTEAGGLGLPFHKPQTQEPSLIQTVQWLPFRESLDLIYKNIQLLNPDTVIRSLMVTSARAGEGKSTLVLGLALSAARLHKRVLLIDADLRRPTLHQQLNLPNEQGLSSLLFGETTFEPNSLSISSLGSNIDVLTAGPPPVDPVSLLSSRRMRELMAVFEQTYDLVLLDTPPILGMVDAIQAASFCQGVVLVGRIDHITQSDLTQATAMLSQLNVLGVVANGARRAMTTYAERNGTLASQLYQSVGEEQGADYN